MVGVQTEEVRQVGPGSPTFISMTAPHLQEVCEGKVSASWYFTPANHTNNNSTTLVRAKIMSDKEQYTVKQVDEEQLGVYVGCVQGSTNRVPPDPHTLPIHTLACPVRVKVEHTKPVKSTLTQVMAWVALFYPRRWDFFCYAVVVFLLLRLLWEVVFLPRLLF